jgi:hypothetical protein
MKADGSITAWGNAASGGSGAPAGSFVTVQSPLVSDPAFAAFPVNSALTVPPSEPFFAHLGAQGVGARYEITVGSLPTGLTLDANTGAVSGTTTQSGSYFFVLTASTAIGTGTQTFTLQVPQLAALVISAWPTATAISYGQTLASSTLSGGEASVAGTFAFTSPSTAPATGTAEQAVTFTPTDAVNYSAVSGTASVVVNQATPSVSAAPTATAITYGQTLASSTLSGGAA